jgi:hypothetical protein
MVFHAPGDRPRLEVFEDRTVPSVLTVMNTLDSGTGSLRDMIAAAKSNDSIVFDPSLNSQPITLTSGELAITKSLDIEGLGASQLTISGNDASRVFDISRGSVVTIAGLTITHGRADEDELDRLKTGRLRSIHVGLASSVVLPASPFGLAVTLALAQHAKGRVASGNGALSGAR